MLLRVCAAPPQQDRKVANERRGQTREIRDVALVEVVSFVCWCRLHLRVDEREGAARRLGQLVAKDRRRGLAEVHHARWVPAAVGLLVSPLDFVYRETAAIHCDPGVGTPVPTQHVPGRLVLHVLVLLGAEIGRVGAASHLLPWENRVNRLGALRHLAQDFAGLSWSLEAPEQAAVPNKVKIGLADSRT